MAFSKEQLTMTEIIQHEFSETADLTGIQHLPDTVRQALLTIPRETFFPENTPLDVVYDNQPSRIGHAQTISQPYIVALMTALLDPKPDQKILEVGTGSGYQAAILGTFDITLDTVEVIPELHHQAQHRLEQLGLKNVNCLLGDIHTLPLKDVYDGMIVTAAPLKPPKILLDHLQTPGKLVIPIGKPHNQKLITLTKNLEGRLEQQVRLPVQFVPLINTQIRQ